MRTTAPAVKLLVETDDTVSTDLAPFIEAANSLVTKFCDDGLGTNSEAQLELIERWLAAHFYKIRDAAVSNESAGGVGAGFQYKIDYGLALTHWGQQAMAFDFTGNLAAWCKQVASGRAPRVGVTWLGTERS